MTPVQAMNEQSGFRVTGRTVLFALIGFFGLIFAANGVMLWLALSSHTGTVVGSSYRAGGTFQADVDAARAQAERGWAVSADLLRSGPGAVVEIVVKDAGGAPVSGLAVTAGLANPTQAGKDIALSLVESETGRYGGAIDTLEAGNWRLVIEAARGDERLYRSENKVMIR